MKTSLWIGGIAAGAMLVSLAIAQQAAPGHGFGYGPGHGAGYGAGGGCGMACGQPVPGYGPGAGHGPGPRYGMGGGPRDAYALLAPEERLAFRDRLHAAASLQECKAIVAEEARLVAERARERGVAAPTADRRLLMCDRMDARGFFD